MLRGTSGSLLTSGSLFITLQAGPGWWAGSPRAMSRTHGVPPCLPPCARLHLFLFPMEISSLVRGTAAIFVYLLVLILLML